MDLTISLTLSDSQSLALSYVTNVFNKDKAPNQQLTPTQYAALQLTNAIDSYVTQRSDVRTRYGLFLYSNADPSTKETVDNELHLPPDFPTGNE